MYKNKKVSVVIPTYNEADSIRSVIEGFFTTGVVDEIIVVDNNALGNTEDEIRKTKARRVVEKKQGYGHAIMRGLLEAKGDLLIMVEGDGTFDPEDIHKFLLYSDNFPVVFGTRTSRAAIWSGAFMPFSVRLGNWAVAKFLEVLHNGPTLTDVGCTYKLVTHEALEKIKPMFLLSRGDDKWSPEFMIWVLKGSFSPIEIPVIYKSRIGDSTITGSTWRAAKLGLRMLPMIMCYRFKKI